eukprot:jgi/Mesvir1/25107/Mv21570-RA.1
MSNCEMAGRGPDEDLVEEEVDPEKRMEKFREAENAWAFRLDQADKDLKLSEKQMEEALLEMQEMKSEMEVLKSPTAKPSPKAPKKGGSDLLSPKGATKGESIKSPKTAPSRGSNWQPS